MIDAVKGFIFRWAESIPNEGRRLRVFAPGTELTFRVRGEGLVEWTETVTLTDEAVQSVILRPRRPLNSIVVRVVDGNGAPRKISDLVFAIHRTGGRAALHFKPDPSSSDPSLYRAYHAPFRGRSLQINDRVHGIWGDEPLATMPLIEERASTKTLDFGTVTIPKPPIWISGLVIDEDGFPVAGVHLAGKAEVERKRARNSMWATSGPDGTFEIRAFDDSTPDSNFEIQARHGFRSSPVPFSPGDRHVIVRVQRESFSAIEGRVRCANPELGGLLEVKLKKDGRNFGRRIEHNGCFRFETRETGLYRLTVHLGGNLVFEQEIEIEPATVHRPEECADLIVGENFAIEEIRVFDRLGAPIPECNVTALLPGEPTKWTSSSIFYSAADQTDLNGFAQILVDRTKHDRVYLSPSRSSAPYRSRVIENPQFPLRVVLEEK